MPHYSVFFLTLWVAAPQSQQSAERFAEVASETTIFNVHYGKYLNRELGHGLAAEENFVADMVQILGPDRLLSADGRISRQLIGQLNMKLRPTDRQYFVPWTRFCKSLHLEDAEFEELNYDAAIKCLFDPWTATQQPHIKKWLQVNEHLLDDIHRALHQDHVYFPAWPSSVSGPGVEAVTISYWMDDIESFVGTRATHAIATGQYDTAIKEAESIYRLGKLYSKGKSWRNHLNGERRITYYLYLSRRIAQSKIQKSQLRQIREFYSVEFV